MVDLLDHRLAEYTELPPAMGKPSSVE